MDMTKEADSTARKMRARIDVLFDCPAWEEQVRGAETLVRRAALATLAHGRTSGAAELAILLADDTRLRELNLAYRGQDKATNVLSFTGNDGNADTFESESMRHLGDIALAFETVAREAEEQGKSLADHTAHLVVHGTLHLLGYDHEKDVEAEAMEAEEIAILASLGIDDPYILSEAEAR